MKSDRISDGVMRVIVAWLFLLGSVLFSLVLCTEAWIVSCLFALAAACVSASYFRLPGNSVTSLGRIGCALVLACSVMMLVFNNPWHLGACVGVR